MRRMLWVLSLVVAVGACGDNLRPALGDDDDDGQADDADTSSNDDAAVDDGSPGDDDASSTVDARPGDGMMPDAPGAGGVMCGNTTCQSGQVCCVNLGGSTCVAAGSCTGQSITCDGPEDCTTAGEVCCAGLGGTSCAAENTCLGEVCHVDGDCDQGEECCGPMTAPRVCRNVCPGPPGP